MCTQGVYRVRLVKLELVHPCRIRVCSAGTVPVLEAQWLPALIVPAALYSLLTSRAARPKFGFWPVPGSFTMFQAAEFIRPQDI